MTETPETIYLIPGETWDSPEGLCWCDDPAPGEGMDPAEAVKYVRADKHREIIDRQAKAAFKALDNAKQAARLMQVRAERVLAEHSPEALESERAANAALTDQVEELETMARVFRDCIETGVLPEAGSQLYLRLIGLVGVAGHD